MRFLALFLSIIVFTLTLSPCCALEESEGHENESKQEKHHECDKPSDDCCKDCSPFYVCGTCIGFTLTTHHVVAVNIPIKVVKHNTAYLPIKLPLIPLAIWQPPKLS